MIEATDIPFIVKNYHNNPQKFSKDILNIKELDIWQDEFFDDFQKYNRISISSCNGSGKTFAVGCLALFFLMTRKQATIILVSNSQDQLKNTTLRTVQNIARSSKISDLLEFQAMKIGFKDAIGADEASIQGIVANPLRPINVQGIHADNLLIIVDEASGLDDEIFQSLMGNLTKKGNKIVLIGNPNKTNTTFHKTFSNQAWNNRYISAFDCAHTNKEWINEITTLYGSDSDIYRTRILGQFPLQDNSQSLITEEVFNKCFNLKLDKRIYEKEKVIVGVDVAAGGDDTCVCVRQGKKIHFFSKFNIKDFMIQANEIVDIYKRFNGDQIIVDSTGLGIGLVSILRSRLSYNQVVEFNYGTRSNQPLYYKTIRDEVWDNLRIEMNSGIDLSEISLAFKEDLKNELLNVEYYLNSLGKICVASKNEMKKLMGHSPDMADSLCLALYIKTGYKKIEVKSRLIDENDWVLNVGGSNNGYSWMAF